MGIGIKEIVIILLVALLVFGSSRLKSLGTDLGAAIRSFRQGARGDGEPRS